MDSKISALLEVTTLTDNDVLPIVNGGETKKVTVNNLRSGIAGGDLQGNYPNPTVHQIQGKAVQNGNPFEKDVMFWDDTAKMWKHRQILTTDITDTDGVHLVTTAQQTIINNQSGVNTGDETNSTIISKIGFTPENVSNKQTDLTASSTKYPTVNAVINGLATKQNTIGSSDSITEGTTNLFLTTAERTKLTNTSGTNTGDETQSSILSKLGYTPIKSVIKDTTVSATYTGTAENMTAMYMIPANTFSSNDIMKITSFLAEKTGILGSCIMRVKVGTTSTFSSATTIATYTTGITEVWCILQRSSITLRGGNLRSLLATTPRQNDITATASGISNITFNPAIDNYIFTSLQLSVGTDSVFQSNFIMTN